jgi:hypothetical protein
VTRDVLRVFAWAEAAALLTTVLGLLWGLAQGARHALEPDHLAAVSTLVTERRSARSAASYALAWGVGHAFVLLLFGSALLLVRAKVPDRVAAVFELGVAAMLIGLGARALARAVVRRAAGVDVAHRHGAGAHAHGGPVDHVHVRGFTLARQPLVVGCVHGLAGSGALAALVASQMSSTLSGVATLAVYGGGAGLGMAALAGVAGVPLTRLARTRRGVPLVLAASGALSLLLGVAWAWSAASVALAVE